MKTKRYNGEDGSEVDAMEEANKGENLDTTPGPVAKRTPIVTKEQLAASGLSLRDYLNKQQGLTRRGGSEKSTRMPARPGQETPISSNEGRNNPRKPGMYSGTIKDIKDVFKKNPNRKSFFEANDERIAALKSGGSVSSASKRADGIAVRGKTKGKMC